MRELDERIHKAYVESIIEARKFDLGSGHMGNGITVWNRAREVHGDYETIAHVDANRKIKYYIKNPPKEVKDYVEKIAKGPNMHVSATQSQKVFRESLEEGYGSLSDYAVTILEKEIEKIGFKKSGRVLTLKGDDNVKIDRAKDLVKAINTLTNSKMKVKVHDGFTDIVK